MKRHKDICQQNPSVVLNAKAKAKAKGKGRQQTLHDVVGEGNTSVETEAVNTEAGEGAVE